MRDEPEVLWVDDDSPKTARTIEGIRVIPAQSCMQADKIIGSGNVQPTVVIMDLILPQDGWGSGFMKLPGLDFLRHLRKQGLKSVVYTIVADEERQAAALRCGAEKVYEKTKYGFVDVIRNIRDEIIKETEV